MRIVVFGANGFVGSAVSGILKTSGHEVLEITRKEADLSDFGTLSASLKSIMRKGDKVVLAAAKAPAKNFDDFLVNIKIIENITKLLIQSPPSYILNISSDAVYSDSHEPLCENSFMAPYNAHGLMHCFRERLLEQSFPSAVGHLRPTLIFGPGDPHGGYGPNMFLRLAKSGDQIKIFGEGEELRDHIHIDDVSAIAKEMIEKEFHGPLNAVTGNVVSFREIAELANSLNSDAPAIAKISRTGPMPHNGYRAFDNKKLMHFIPNKTFVPMTKYFESG